jgi:anti-sigma-K factor RskA
MNDHDIQNRFEELEAGRILGDLDAGEIKEWELLAKDPRCKRDFSLALTAAAIEAEFLQFKQSELPETLKEKLRTDIAEFVIPVPATVVGFPAWRRILSATPFAWGVAAALAILLVTKQFLQEPQSMQPPSLAGVALAPAEAKNQLMRKAVDLKETDFGGLANYGQMTGKVIWSDTLQEGYLTLTNLPVNDPAVRQYQLWIVDPKRDEKPVDGGVFDIPATGAVVIPIRNPVAVNDPRAFVITMEQPGGVVVSKQQVVVAIAKAS